MFTHMNIYNYWAAAIVDRHYTLLVFRGRECAKRWCNIILSRAEARKEGMLSEHSVSDLTQDPQICLPCFGRGRAERWRHHPVTREQRPEKKACPLNTVSRVTSRTHRLVNRINSRVAEREGEHT